MARDTSSAGRTISTIRIIGTPPPLGIPLELTDKLMLGRSTAVSTMFAALVVSRGRKIHMTQSIAPAPPIGFSPSGAAMPRRAPQARAAENCDAPPYGGTAADYHAFVQRFGRIVKPEKMLADICRAKFGNSPRDRLHKLGLTDAKINSENTEQLAEDTIVALKNLVNKLE